MSAESRERGTGNNQGSPVSGFTQWWARASRASADKAKTVGHAFGLTHLNIRWFCNVLI